MPAASKSSGKTGLITYRQKELFIGPPGIMGFANLLVPDEDAAKRFNQAPEFKVNIHFDSDSQQRLIDLLEGETEALVSGYEREAGKDAKRPDPREFVEDKLKEAHERSKCQDPYMVFKNKADYKDRDGVTHRKTMRAWDSRGNDLDLPGLHLGMGSLIQPVCQLGMWSSPLVKNPTYSFSLQGVRVLKLVAFGGGASVGRMSDDELAAIGDIEVDDLSAFARKDDQEDKPTRPRRSESSNYASDMDDELPF